MVTPPATLTNVRNKIHDVWTIGCFYLVVLGRLPDPDGLAAYVDHLAGGLPLAELATVMTGSDEFRSKVGTGTSADYLCANARGEPPDQFERALPVEELALALVTDPDVQLRLGVVERMFPDDRGLDNELAYALWAYEDDLRRKTQSRSITTADGPDLLSLIIVLERPDLSLVRSMLESNLQRNRRLQVVLAYRGRLSPDITDILTPDRNQGAFDIVQLPGWRSPVALRNKALRLCRGTFVALLGQHDRLAEQAVSDLAVVAPHSDIVYADADRIGPDGVRRDPTFHAAWDPDFALAGPPRGLVMVRTALVRALGGWRAAAEGEHDWDMLLRASLRADPSAIRYIPAVLRHRIDPPASPGRRDPGLAIVRAHLRATGRRRYGVHRMAGAGPVRIIYPLPASPPLVSIIIPTRDRAALLRPCLDGLLKRTDYPAIEVLVVDNDSREAETRVLFDELKKDGRVRVVEQRGAFNWSALNNHGVRTMRGEVAVLLNNDTDVIDPNWLKEMVAHALRPDVGIVGAKLLYRDGTIQHAGIVLGPNGRGSHIWRHAARDATGHNNQLAAVRTMSAVTGACMAFRRGVFEEAGGIEQETLQVTWSDVDFCLRVRAAGYRVVWNPHALLYHLELASRGSEDTPEAMRRYAREQDHMRRLWGAALDSDPYFSPFLEAREGAPVLAKQGDPPNDRRPRKA